MKSKSSIAESLVITKSEITCSAIPAGWVLGKGSISMMKTEI